LSGKKIFIGCLAGALALSGMWTVAAADTGYADEKYTINSHSKIKQTEVVEEGLYQWERVSFDDGVVLDLYRMPTGDVLYIASATGVKGGPRYLRLRIKDGAKMAVRAMGYRDAVQRTGLILEDAKQTTGRYPSRSVLVGESVFLSASDEMRPSLNKTFAALRSDAVGLSIVPDNSDGIAPGDREFIITIPASGDKLGVQWGYLGQGTLFAGGKVDSGALEAADLNLRRKIIPGGMLDPTSTDYVPGGTDIYWMNPALFPATAAIRPENAQHPLLDAVARLGTRLAIANQNEAGYWETAPGSKWLQTDYGIEPGYYDTRFATDAGMLLMGAFDRYQDEAALAAAEKYAEYLLHHINERGIRTQTGILVPDYWHEEVAPRVVPHISLNHQLTEMNYLYRLYIATSKDVYRDGARLLQRGINDTGMAWRRPDGDLWYGLTADGKYIRQDYPTLTYYDLQKAEFFMQRAEGYIDQTIINLRLAKQAYMDKMKIAYRK
jgi:hypothetical protein